MEKDVVYTIKGQYASLNEWIDANRVRRGKWSAGNSMKQRDQRDIELQIRRQGIRKIKEPVFIEFSFYCRSRKVDPDNISGYFHKIFLDALVKTGVIEDDGWKHVAGFCDKFLQSQDPEVVIRLTTEWG